MGDLERAAMKFLRMGECDSLLPSQLGTESKSPERKLMCAVVDEALQCLDLRATATAPGEERRKAQVVAAQWFASDDRSGPFSFLNLCDHLGLNPSAVLAAIGMTGGRVRRPPAYKRRIKINSSDRFHIAMPRRHR